MVDVEQGGMPARPEAAPTQWPWRIFIFALSFFILIAVIYLGLIIGYEPYLESQIAAQDEEIMALARSIPAEEQQSLITLYAQLSNLQIVLGDHVAGSQLLAFLEQSTNQNVMYGTLNFNAGTRELSLEGNAQSFDVLAQQIEAFRRSPNVERVTVNFSDARGTVVGFGMTVVVQEALLRPL